MPEVTPFVRPSNERSRELVRQRIADGRWRVDVEAGIVYGERGQALRGKRNTSGYVQYSFRDRGGRVCVSGHLVIWEFVHGPVPYPMQVNHLNGIKDDNRIVNLELLTPGDNIRHARLTGLNLPARGRDKPNSILRDDDVREIRRMLAQGATRRQCAERFGVSKPLIGDIKMGRSWRHVAP